MKRIRLTVALFVLLFLIQVPLTAYAMNTGLDTYELSDEEISSVMKHREFVKISTYTPLAVKCFDVRDDHMIVVGADAGSAAVIAVYDDSGVFQYGFKTEEPGSFRVMWSENAIVYYSIRGNCLFEIDEDGKITDMRRVETTTKNSVYDQKVLLSTTRNVGASTYCMTNERIVADALPGFFKKIVKTDAGGSTVIYDASGDYHTRIVSGIVFFTILSLFIVFCIIVGVKKIVHNIKQKAS